MSKPYRTRPKNMKPFLRFVHTLMII